MREELLEIVCQNSDVFLLIRKCLMRYDVRKIACKVSSQETVVECLCERDIPIGDIYEQKKNN